MSAPRIVFGVKSPTGEFCLVERGQPGYYPSTEEVAAPLIAAQGPELTRSALAASMFGWHVPAARLANAAPGTEVHS